MVAIYALIAWLILQIAETTFSPLGFPDWAMRVLIVIAIVGFPVAFILAWVVDIRPEGLIFDLPLWRGTAERPREETKTDLVVVAILVVMLGVGTYGVFKLIMQDIGDRSVPQVSATHISPNSIAVLAFDNFEGSSETDYFASGLAEEILNLLAGIDELKVAARTSSFQFRGAKVGIPEVAELLNVRYVLEGSVRLEDGRIRVTAQLIDGSNGFHDWSQTYERDLEGIFSIQQEIAFAVVSELKVALSVDSKQSLQLRPTENIDAYVFYLKGREKLRSSADADVMRTASSLFESALRIDPDMSRAYSGICEARLGLYAITSDADDYAGAQDACDEAVRLDSGLNAENHLARGVLFRYGGDYEAAEEELRNAITISPTNSDAYIELAEISMAQGLREEAEATFLRAVDLNRAYWKAHEGLANFYYRTERYNEAVRAYGFVTTLAPDGGSGFIGLGSAYWMLGDPEKARTAWDRAARLKPNRESYTNTGIANYYTGRFEEAVEMQLKALEYANEDQLLWGRLAESYRFVAGQEEKALAAYRKAARYAQDILAINENDWRTRGLLGLYYVHLGQSSEGSRFVDRAVEESGRNAEALYYQALARLVLGETEGALDALAESLGADPYYQQFVDTDPDLAQLRGNERLEALRSN